MISIVVPNHNKGGFIGETLDSLLSQTFTDWEAIIVDDASTDSSLSVIKDYVARDSRFVSLTTEGGPVGGSASRNQGVALASRPFLLFLDSDDLITPTCLEDRLREIEKSEDDFQLHPGGTFYEKIGDSPHEWHADSAADHLKQFLSHQLPWNISGPLWRTEFLRKVGGFNTALPRFQDVELHIRALLLGPQYSIKGSKTPDFYYRISRERTAISPYGAAEREVRALQPFLDSITLAIGQTPGANHSALRRWLRGTVTSVVYSLTVKQTMESLERSHYDELSERIFTNERVAEILGESWSGVLSTFSKHRLFRFPGVHRLTRRAAIEI
jgi:glycosyltransferase involved in cell wall biosynthesis